MVLEIRDKKKEVLLILFSEDLATYSMESLKNDLEEILEVVIDEFSVVLRLAGIKNISLEYLYSILSFSKSLLSIQSRLFLEVESELSIQLLDLGLGSLVYSIEEIPLD
jgi:hypothetical protein